MASSESEESHIDRHFEAAPTPACLLSCFTVLPARRDGRSLLEARIVLIVSRLRAVSRLRPRNDLVRAELARAELVRVSTDPC